MEYVLGVFQHSRVGQSSSWLIEKIIQDHNRESRRNNNRRSVGYHGQNCRLILNPGDCLLVAYDSHGSWIFEIYECEFEKSSYLQSEQLKKREDPWKESGKFHISSHGGLRLISAGLLCKRKRSEWTFFHDYPKSLPRARAKEMPMHPENPIQAGRSVRLALVPQNDLRERSEKWEPSTSFRGIDGLDEVRNSDIWLS
jgi:hypothetical protein